MRLNKTDKIILPTEFIIYWRRKTLKGDGNHEV